MFLSQISEQVSIVAMLLAAIGAETGAIVYLALGWMKEKDAKIDLYEKNILPVLKRFKDGGSEN